MKIYELLDTPEKWTKRAMARDGYGCPIGLSRIHEAACWCVIGAAVTCYGQEGAQRVCQMIGEHIGALEGVSEWNDKRSRTYDDVISLCKELDV
jgi:hypothetical protein